jgi:RNA polymerase sigma-70 factor (ECF subfamily)
MEDAMQLVCKPEPELASKMSPVALFQDIEVGGLRRSDEELVIAAQNGDSCALGELLGRHQKLLYCVARRYTANTEEAHDLVQETMLRAIRNIRRFRGESRFVTWLNSIVINQAISNKRREKHIRWIALDEQEGEEARFCTRSLRDVRRNPEEDFSHRELRGLLRREALKLHPKYRFILMACDLDECSIEDVARLQRMHLAAAKSRLHRARRSLSTAMKKSGAVGVKIPAKRHRV